MPMDRGRIGLWKLENFGQWKLWTVEALDHLVHGRSQQWKPWTVEELGRGNPGPWRSWNV